MGVLVSIGFVAELFGVTTQTIRNWARQGLFTEYRTAGRHRRFSLEEVEKVKGIAKAEEAKVTVVYSRVSSQDQKEDLQRQTEELKEYCNKQGIEEVEVIEDLGSGINYNKKGLKKLLRWIIQGTIKCLVLSYKDRLLRFGSELLLQICRLKQIEVIIIHSKSNTSFEYELAEDVRTILTVYSSKIYGRRSHEKRRQSA